jgi:hypothetical protein
MRFLAIGGHHQRPLLLQKPPANRIRRGSCKFSYGIEINGQLTVANESHGRHARRPKAGADFNFSETNGR